MELRNEKRGWTPSGVLGYDCLPRQKKFRGDIGIRVEHKTTFYKSTKSLLFNVTKILKNGKSSDLKIHGLILVQYIYHVFPNRYFHHFSKFWYRWKEETQTESLSTFIRALEYR